MGGGRYSGWDCSKCKKWPGLAFGKLQREASKFKSYIFLRICHHFTGCQMCFLLHQISVTDFHCLLSFLFKKGSKELWQFSSDYQRLVKFHWSSSWNSGPFPALPLTHTQNWVSCGTCGLKHTSGLVGNTYRISSGSTEGSEEAYVSNLESWKNRLVENLIENGNEGDAVVTSANHCVVCRRACV